MINILPAFLRRKQQYKETSSAMSFTIEESGPGNPIAEWDAGTCRKFYRHGNSFSYSMGQGSFTSKDLAAMSMAKGYVIGIFSSDARNPEMPSLGDARKAAFFKLSSLADSSKAEYLSYFVAHDTIGSGPFSIILEDRLRIEEIEVNSPNSPIVVYTSEYGRCPTNIRFSSEAAFRHCVNKLLLETEKELNDDFPIIDAQVADSRIHAQIRPYAASGAAASIRIGKGKKLGLRAMLRSGTMDAEAIAYLWLTMDSGMSVVVAGAPASGKTTVMGMVASLAPKNRKTIIIEEEIGELDISATMPNILSLKGTKTGNSNTRSQMINALRMRPDRIIVGEIRGEETRELFAGANIGIPFLTTMHSNSDGISVIKKLMVRPMSVEPGSLSMLDVSVYMRQSGISSRVMSSINEYRWLSRAEIDEGMEIGNGDSVDIRAVAVDGKTKKESIMTSKALLKFSRARGITMKAARAEASGRIDFIKKIAGAEGQEIDLADQISEYLAGESYV